MGDPSPIINPHYLFKRSNSSNNLPDNFDKNSVLDKQKRKYALPIKHLLRSQNELIPRVPWSGVVMLFNTNQLTDITN
jgi:hypothetical protein